MKNLIRLGLAALLLASAAPALADCANCANCPKHSAKGATADADKKPEAKKCECQKGKDCACGKDGKCKCAEKTAPKPA